MASGPGTEQYGPAPPLPGGRTVAVSVHRRRAPDVSMFVALWDTTTPHRGLPQDSRRLGPALGPQVLPRRHDPRHGHQGHRPRSRDRIDPAPEGFDPSLGSRHGPGAETIPRGGSRRPVARFSPDGKLLAAAVTDGTVRFYDLGTGLERMPCLGPEPASAASRRRLSRPSAAQGAALPGFLARWVDPRGGAQRPGGSGQATSSLARPHPPVGRRRGAGSCTDIPAHQEWVASLAFSPDGKTLASTGAEPVVRLWDVATGREAFPQSGHRSAVSKLVVSPADGTVFTGGSDGTIRQWDPSSGRELGLIARVRGPIEGWPCADGKTLLVSVMEYEPRSVAWIGIFSVAERREIRRLAGVREREHSEHVAYSPDGKTIASEGQVWNAGSGEVLVTLRHQDPKKDRFLSYCPIDYTPDERATHHGGARRGSDLGFRRRPGAATGGSVVQPPPSCHTLARRPIPGYARRRRRISRPIGQNAHRRLGAVLGPGGRAAQVAGRVDPLPALLPRRSIPGHRPLVIEDGPAGRWCGASGTSPRAACCGSSRGTAGR